MEESNYALYRNQFKKINPSMDEKDIYAGWHALTFGEWPIQSSPLKGYDGMYHYLYISERDDGAVYVGKHSTNDLNDGYVGSGTEVKESQEQGHSFKKTVLEYFRNANAAYDTENKVVNNRFLNESNGLVLNHSVGGKSYVPASVGKVSQKSRTASCSSEIKSCGKPRYYTFSMLGLKVGDKVTLIDNDNITCVVNDDKTVKFNNRVCSLYTAAKNASKASFRNPLDMWKFKGKTLSKIRDEKFNS